MNPAVFRLLLLSFLAPAILSAQEKRAETPPPTSPPLLAADIASLPEGMERIDLYLLIGQSNMKGRGLMPEVAKNDPAVVMMHMKDDSWYLARHPLHLTGDAETFRGHDNAGVGPGLAFAEAVLQDRPEARIGLIPCARGGSAISLWSKDGPLYAEAVRRAKLALSQGPAERTRLGGVLWLQGESDARPGKAEPYAESLHNLVDRLRADLDDPDLPFLACTIGEMRPDTPANPKAAINAILLDLPKHRARTACVDARDLTGHIGDRVHFDTASQEEIGRRYAAALRSLDPADEKAGPPPRSSPSTPPRRP